MRRTVHLIAAEDAGWLIPLFGEATVRWSRKRLADFGLDRRGQDRALEVLHDAVDAEGPLTRPELAERLERAGFDAANEFKVHLWLLATLDGELCLGPDRGANACLVRTADWIGPLARRSREDSLAELARRYLRALRRRRPSAISPVGPACRCATRGSGSSGSRASSARGPTGCSPSAAPARRPLAGRPDARRLRQLQPRIREPRLRAPARSI